MAKLSYNGGSIWSPIKYDPVTCLVFIQTDRGMYAEKEEGNKKLQFNDFIFKNIFFIFLDKTCMNNYYLHFQLSCG